MRSGRRKEELMGRSETSDRWAILAVSVGLMLAVALPAGAKVERYQYTDYTINVTSVNGNTAYIHTFYLTHNPCTDVVTGYGVNHYHGDSNETLSNIQFDGDKLSFRADYDINNYYWEPGFILNADGTFTWDGGSAGGVDTATGTWESTQTDYKNHGQYVAQSINGHGPDAHSCIGMPVVSKGHSG
jgi:hypothetical protein